MEKVEIKAMSEDGKELVACFLPSMGMNFISYIKGDLEVIDQSTRPLFEERFAGLGAMIGPHFHHRNPQIESPIKNESLFPHIACVKARGIQDFFSHGIGRYAPWSIESVDDTHIKSILRGDASWRGIPLKELEGQNFLMEYEAKMTPQGLEIHLAVKGDIESLVGLHTYYALVDGKGRVTAQVQDQYNDQGTFKPIPSTWDFTDKQKLCYEFDQAMDFGFHGFPDPLSGSIFLETGTHKLHIQYWCDNEENSWQLWHPKGASFVCIEPLSAKNPRKPTLTVNSLKILISILV